MQQTSDKIFARTDSADFVGRAAELDRLLNHAKTTDTSGLALLAVPSAGTSELLRQTYDRLFSEQEVIIPFYFEIKPSDHNAQNTARRFLYEFLLQTVAFRRRDAKIIYISPEIDELAELAAPSYGHWIDRLVEIFHRDVTANGERSFVRNCLSAPLRAATHDARTFVMIDALHTSAQLDGGDIFLDDFVDIFSRASIPFVFAGHRRFLFAKTKFETMPVEPLVFSDAGELATRLSAQTGVAINDQTRDLITVQLGGLPGFFNCLFGSASAKDVELNSFDRVEHVYTENIFGGQIARYFDPIFDRILPDTAVRTKVLRLMSELLINPNSKMPHSHWKNQTGQTNTEFNAMLEALNFSEFINISSGSVAIDGSNVVLNDYIKGRLSLEVDGKTRALAVGEAVSDNFRRAPELMARFYRKKAAIGVRELLRNFDGRKISPALIDYGKFKDEFKGADDSTILKALNEDNAKINLPQIVYTAHTGDFYSKLNELCDIERSTVALGFADAGEREEIVWITAEIDSKLEANRELVEFWCDRLEMAAMNCNFTKFHLWLIAPEGFDPKAMEALYSRNAYGSSGKQVVLLADILGTDIGSSTKDAANEYEFVFPMGENTEMIAAHTVEEIAKRHAFPAKAINQIKTALVEACINATEHSLSPDRKIHQKFIIDNDKITITVSNRGLRLIDKVAKEIVPDEGRRGWGLKLIKGLMDEVKIEQVDDGTRVTMVKYYKQV
ncbi:MAG: ATP-binding protein [Pyrinomonadaceae bacterium]